MKKTAKNGASPAKTSKQNYRTLPDFTRTHSGIDPVQEPTPVQPTAHYAMGGIPTDVEGRVISGRRQHRLAGSGMPQVKRLALLGMGPTDSNQFINRPGCSLGVAPASIWRNFCQEAEFAASARPNAASGGYCGISAYSPQPGQRQDVRCA
ncbi:MAG: FAD-binding protein [bacterium]|nr:FAD-binding protein [bacterium]